MCQSATNIFFIVIFSSILMSYIICKLTCSYSSLIFTFLVSLGVTLSSISIDIWTFAIYFAIALVQNPVLNFLSISYAFFTILGTLIPKLCDVRQYLYSTLEIILSQWRKVSLNHQLKAGSSLISSATAYSASSTGLDCLSSFSGNQ